MSVVSEDIGAQRLLSNGASLALLDPCGQITWWCAPDPESAPLLWRLLAEDGAAARWIDCAPYLTPGGVAGPTLRTIVTGHSGRLELWDALLLDRDGGPFMVRLVRGLDRALLVDHELVVGGFDDPPVHWADDGSACVNDMSLHVHGGHSAVNGTFLTTTVTAPRGRWAAVTIGINTVAQEVSALVAQVQTAAAEHERGLAGIFPPRHHPERARDALAVLRSCTYRSTGAVLAAATTSLPEAVGGSRQFDSLLLAARRRRRGGRRRPVWEARSGEAVPALRRRDRATHNTDSGSPPIVTDVHGRPVPEEREVEGIAGWQGSRPVRVGNGAPGQVQHDAVGMFIEAVSVYIQQGGKLDASTWALTRGLVDLLCKETHPTNGIWEFRTPRLLLSADKGPRGHLHRGLVVGGRSPRGGRTLRRSASTGPGARYTAAPAICGGGRPIHWWQSRKHPAGVGAHASRPCLYLLDAADVRRRFTVVGLSAWRPARFVSLRTRPAPT